MYPVLLLFLAIPLFASEQDTRYDATGLYKTPAEAIPATIRRELQTYTQGSERSVPEKINGLEKTLKRYYLQFSSQKRTWEQKQLGPKLQASSSIDEKRRYIRNMRRQLTQSNLIRNSEILYSIHRNLGALYQKENRRQKAISAYVTALRYRDLSQTEKSFMDDKNWQEIDRTESLNARKSHKQAYENWQQAQKDLEKTKLQVHQDIARAGRKGSNELLPPTNVSAQVRSLQKTAQQKIIAAQKKLQASKQAYETSYKQNYLPIQQQRARQDAKTYASLAKLVRELEAVLQGDRNLKRQAHLYQSQPSIVFDATRTSQHPAYVALLEVAQRLDQQEPEYPRLIAQEKKLEGKIQQAIDYYEKYIDLLLNKQMDGKDLRSIQKRQQFLDNIPPGLSDEQKMKLKNTHLALAVLYSDVRKNVLASQNYRRYLQLETDEKARHKWNYHIGRFFVERVGNLPIGCQYLQEWLDKEEKQTIDAQTKQEEYLAHKKKMVTAYTHLGRFAEYQRQTITEQEKVYLKAYQQYIALKTEQENRKKKWMESKKMLEKSKKPLLYKHDRDLFAKYTALQAEHRANRQKYNLAQITYRSIAKSKLLFKLAELREKQKDFSQARKYYREIIQSGNRIELSYAQQNLLRLDSYTQYGLKRNRTRPY